jgi:RNA methyltransferase, TrmH family
VSKLTITSPHNEQLKEVRKLAGRKWRDKLRLFVAEGEDLVEAAARAGWRPEALYVAEGSGLDGVPVAPHVLAGFSQLGSGTRALGVYGQRWAPAPLGPVCVALWGVNDPGNVGTVLRSALAFGAGSGALGPGSADPYGPKAVRASMGALFEVPVARVRGVGELPGRRVALVAGGGRALEELDAAAPGGGAGLTLVVGAERQGLPSDVVAACDEVAHIPIRSESLNAGMAATVALYEVTRRTGAGEAEN